MGQFHLLRELFYSKKERNSWRCIIVAIFGALLFSSYR
ncbi:hypothetical protein ADIS_1572 [Lunatimonas lonarensis]|uniref:Uncharacterized protein n=1 Tax=Lunatimonas lonarensis TaxID=1232681 RepID=R7ZVH8_9BACT|nr:hypothetical protein ADIS_1572 [Lunatimonas lonarensis]